MATADSSVVDIQSNPVPWQYIGLGIGLCALCVIAIAIVAVILSRRKHKVDRSFDKSSAGDYLYDEAVGESSTDGSLAAPRGQIYASTGGSIAMATNYGGMPDVSTLTPITYSVLPPTQT